MNEMQHNPWLWCALKLAEKKGEHNRLSSSASALNRSFIQDFFSWNYWIDVFWDWLRAHCTHTSLHTFVPTCTERVIKFNMRHWFFVGWWTLHHVRTVGIGVAHFETRLSFEPSKCCYSFDCRLTCGNMFAQHHS